MQNNYKNKTDVVAFTLTTIVIVLMVIFASYISFYAGEKYGIAITEKKYNLKK